MKKVNEDLKISFKIKFLLGILKNTSKTENYTIKVKYKNKND